MWNNSAQLWLSVCVSTEGETSWSTEQETIEQKARDRRRERRSRHLSLNPKHSVLLLTLWEPLDKHGYLYRNTRRILQTPGRIELAFHSGGSVSKFWHFKEMEKRCHKCFLATVCCKNLPLPSDSFLPSDTSCSNAPLASDLKYILILPTPLPSPSCSPQHTASNDIQAPVICKEKAHTEAIPCEGWRRCNWERLPDKISAARCDISPFYNLRGYWAWAWLLRSHFIFCLLSFLLLRWKEHLTKTGLWKGSAVCWRIRIAPLV